MNEEIESNVPRKEEDSPAFLVHVLKSNKIPREIDYSKITNPIQLKRIQNSTIQIEGYIENLLDIQTRLSKIKNDLSTGKIPDEKFLESKSEICEDTLKNLFEIVALIFNIAENQQPEKRKALLPLILSIEERTEILKNEFEEIFEHTQNSNWEWKLHNIHDSIVNQLKEIKNLLMFT